MPKMADRGKSVTIQHSMKYQIYQDQFYDFWATVQKL